VPVPIEAVFGKPSWEIDSFDNQLVAQLKVILSRDDLISRQDEYRDGLTHFLRRSQEVLLRTPEVSVQYSDYCNSDPRELACRIIDTIQEYPGDFDEEPACIISVMILCEDKTTSFPGSSVNVFFGRFFGEASFVKTTRFTISLNPVVRVYCREDRPDLCRIIDKPWFVIFVYAFDINSFPMTTDESKIVRRMTRALMRESNATEAETKRVIRGVERCIRNGYGKLEGENKRGMVTLAMTESAGQDVMELNVDIRLTVGSRDESYESRPFVIEHPRLASLDTSSATMH